MTQEDLCDAGTEKISDLQFAEKNLSCTKEQWQLIWPVLKTMHKDSEFSSDAAAKINAALGIPVLREQLERDPGLVDFLPDRLKSDVASLNRLWGAMSEGGAVLKQLSFKVETCLPVQVELIGFTMQDTGAGLHCTLGPHKVVSDMLNLQVACTQEPEQEPNYKSKLEHVFTSQQVVWCQIKSRRFWNLALVVSEEVGDSSLLSHEDVLIDSTLSGNSQYLLLPAIERKRCTSGKRWLQKTGTFAELLKADNIPENVRASICTFFNGDADASKVQVHLQSYHVCLLSYDEHVPKALCGPEYRVAPLIQQGKNITARDLHGALPRDDVQGCYDMRKHTRMHLVGVAHKAEPKVHNLTKKCSFDVDYWWEGPTSLLTVLDADSMWIILRPPRQTENKEELARVCAALDMLETTAETQLQDGERSVVHEDVLTNSPPVALEAHEQFPASLDNDDGQSTLVHGNAMDTIGADNAFPSLPISAASRNLHLQIPPGLVCGVDALSPAHCLLPGPSLNQGFFTTPDVEGQCFQQSSTFLPDGACTRNMWSPPMQTHALLTTGWDTSYASPGTDTHDWYVPESPFSWPIPPDYDWAWVSSPPSAQNWHQSPASQRRKHESRGSDERISKILAALADFELIDDTKSGKLGQKNRGMWRVHKWHDDAQVADHIALESELFSFFLDRDTKYELPKVVFFANAPGKHELVQKVVALASVDRKAALASKFSGHIKFLMREPFGCLVLQQLVREAIEMKQMHQGDHVDLESQNEHDFVSIVLNLLKEAILLGRQVVACSISPHGNHVVQKWIELLRLQSDPNILHDLLAEVGRNAVTIGNDQTGCRVLQRLLEIPSSSQLVDTLLEKDTFAKLVKGHYGNWVIQHILGEGRCYTEKLKVLHLISENFHTSPHQNLYAVDDYARHVVQRCFSEQLADCPAWKDLQARTLHIVLFADGTPRSGFKCLDGTYVLSAMQGCLCKLSENSHLSPHKWQ
jgi:hypothetical protein